MPFRATRSVHSSPGVARHLVALLARCLALFVASYALYAAVAWLRFGRVDRAAPAEGDPLLDRFIPAYEVAERHEVRVAAPVELTFAAARDLDLRRSPLIRAILAVRTLPSRLRSEDEAAPPGGLLAEMLSIGWGVLAEVPERAIVVGAVTQPWQPVVRFRSLPPAEFAAFAEPDHAMIVWTLAAEPLGPRTSLARTQTRVHTTDPSSYGRFRRYWALFSPGILLIRYAGLRLVKRDAEQRFAALQAQPDHEPVASREPGPGRRAPRRKRRVCRSRRKGIRPCAGGARSWSGSS